MVRRNERYNEVQDEISTFNIRDKHPFPAPAVLEGVLGSTSNNYAAVTRRLAVCCCRRPGPADRKPPGLASMVR
jgi:hypothetical protein